MVEQWWNSDYFQTCPEIKYPTESFWNYMYILTSWRLSILIDFVTFASLGILSTLTIQILQSEVSVSYLHEHKWIQDILKVCDIVTDAQYLYRFIRL